MIEMTSELEKARENLAEVEHERNLLADELRQAKVDEDNLRNRCNTYQSWKLNNNSSLKASLLFCEFSIHFLKKLKHSQQQLEIEKSVNSDVEIELDNLKKLLILAQERNHITQQSLATLKPYCKSSFCDVILMSIFV
jgi:septation ring formation regulator EzrA